MSPTELMVAPVKQSNGPAKAQRSRPTNEEIATRAYEIFLLRGASHGLDIQD
jgi:hypothetical protein